MLEKNRKDQEQEIVDMKTFYVKRENIVEEMFNIYKETQNFEKMKFLILFLGEKAVGDGVTRDVYTTFYEKFCTEFRGFNQRVPTLSGDSDKTFCLVKLSRMLS